MSSNQMKSWLAILKSLLGLKNKVFRGREMAAAAAAGCGSLAGPGPPPAAPRRPPPARRIARDQMAEIDPIKATSSDFFLTHVENISSYNILSTRTPFIKI